MNNTNEATRLVCLEAAQKLRNYVAIYAGDKQGRRLVDELSNIAAALAATATVAKEGGEAVRLDPIVMRGLQDACDLAMKQTVAARIPECGDFGTIAQGLSWVIQELRDPATSKPEASTPHRVAGLGSITAQDDDVLTLRFKDEDASQDFMRDYEPTVDCRDMPEASAEQPAGERLPCPKCAGTVTKVDDPCAYCGGLGYCGPALAAPISEDTGKEKCEHSFQKWEGPEGETACEKCKLIAPSSSIGDDAEFRKRLENYAFQSRLVWPPEAWKRLIDYIDTRAAASRNAGVVPEGWKLVPKTPSEDSVAEVVYSINRKYKGNPMSNYLALEVWKYFLHGSPFCAANVTHGWKMVPVDPTPEMLDEAGQALSKSGAEGNVLELQGDAHTAYQTMLACSPVPPTAPDTSARKAALEEAANIATVLTGIPGDLLGRPTEGMERLATAGARISAAIRALKTVPGEPT